MVDAPVSSTPGYGRLARRLIVLFVAVSLIPLVISDWLAMVATGDINRSLQNRTESQRVRLVARQVFDKLLNAKLLLGSFPSTAEDASTLPGFGLVFSSASFSAGDASHQSLVDEWNAAKIVSQPVQPVRALAASPLETAIRIVRGNPRPRILMATLHEGNPRWVAEINGGYLWSPIVDASEDNAWAVLDASGAALFASSPENSQQGFPVRSRLFLGAEFDTADWIFESDVAAPTVMWLGLSVGAWLALVATATLLIIALFSLWRIRRALAPLTALTESTRLVGQGGAKPLRIDVKRDDEIGALASAFNDMSARIASQFATLTELAAIDQDILKGVSMCALADRAVDQLASGWSDASVAIEWLESDGTLQRVIRNAGVAPTSAPDTIAEQDRIARFLALGQRSAHAGMVSDSRADGIETNIPIVLDGTTRAAIVWRSAQQIDEQTLLASLNLRDRLAVAFAARDRERELVHLAMHDTLTGLASRYRLHQVLEEVTSSFDTTCSLLFIDLDHFKDVNDSRGHQAGDELLCHIAERLRRCCPEGGVLARQGGDEFALVMTGMDDGEARMLADKILAEVKTPVVLESGPCMVSASVGIAEFPAHAMSREGLLRCADVALYSAKAAGRNGCRVFNSALDLAEQIRVQLAADISGAAARGELVLHYQARVSPHDLKIAGAEALVRWNHPQRGLLGPDEFIHIAEETGAIHEIGGWVIASAAAQMAAWRRSVGTVRVSVNVSPKQFESGALVTQIDQAVANFGITHDALEIEITENVLVGDTESAFGQLAELRSRGVRVALDDFGTGYSSMALLASLPFDVMKIDRSFVQRLSRNDRVRQIVRAIASIGLSAHLTLVAEGIETAEQAAELTALGCDELQGFLFGKPLPADLFVRSLTGRG